MEMGLLCKQNCNHDAGWEEYCQHGWIGNVVRHDEQRAMNVRHLQSMCELVNPYQP